MTKKEKIRYDGARPIGVLVYTTAVSVALMYTICREYYEVCSVIMAVLTAALYMVAYVFRKKPIVSSLITLGLVLICALALGSVGTYWYEGSFVYFIFTSSASFDPIYAAVAIMLFSVVIGLVCCYFSAALPRMCFLMLPSFIPLILSVRTAGGLPTWMLIFMFGSYILAVFCSARKCESKDTTVFEEKNTIQILVSAVAAAAIAVGIGAVLPKSSETLLGEYLDRVFVGTGGFGSRNQSLGNFVVSSAVNVGNNELPDDLLFTVQTNIPVTLDRWVFDEYHGEDGWRVVEDFSIGYSNWSIYASKRQLSALFADLKEGAEDGRLEEYADLILDLPDFRSYRGEMYIRNIDDSPTSVVIHPSGTYSIAVVDYDGRTFRTPKSEYFTETNTVSAEYYLRYFFDVPQDEYIKAFSEVDFRELLITANQEDVINDQQLNAFLDEIDHAEYYREITGSAGVTEDIQRLAEEITAGAENDYEKAGAIERWFGENGFVYDLEFVPEKADANYFIFESRRGICSDFATAMTLISRAAGLAARYVEGFALSDDIRDENGIYNVTGANAHAYTQIYIEGFGWMTFDATRYLPEDVETEDSSISPVIIICGCVVLLAVLVFVFRKNIVQAAFAVTYPMRSSSSRIRGVYIAARNMAADISGRESKLLACGEVCRILSNSLSLPDEAAAICGAANELLYSGKEQTDVDTKYLYNCLKRLRKQKRGLKK